MFVIISAATVFPLFLINLSTFKTMDKLSFKSIRSLREEAASLSNYGRSFCFLLDLSATACSQICP
jgi:hypothetical protein